MTGAQAEWLQKNKAFRAISTHLPSGHTYAQRKVLHPDGTTDDVIRGRAARYMLGDFEVGILTANQDLVRR